jgi:hypothetical protein
MPTVLMHAPLNSCCCCCCHTLTKEVIMYNHASPVAGHVALHCIHSDNMLNHNPNPNSLTSYAEPCTQPRLLLQFTTHVLLAI